MSRNIKIASCFLGLSHRLVRLKGGQRFYLICLNQVCHEKKIKHLEIFWGKYGIITYICIFRVIFLLAFLDLKIPRDDHKQNLNISCNSGCLCRGGRDPCLTEQSTQQGLGYVYLIYLVPRVMCPLLSPGVPCDTDISYL